MPHKQPPLPYSLNELEGFMSEEQMDYHYNKHHKAYFTNLNNLTHGTEYEKMSLEEIIFKSQSGPIFNNAAQAWNHILFWDCMSSDGGGEPTGVLMDKIEQTFGSFEAFKEQFVKAGATLFGSGWVFLASDDAGNLEIMALPNGENPLKYGKKAHLGVDVWEHSYYIDYRNKRPAYLEKFFDAINWDFVASTFE